MRFVVIKKFKMSFKVVWHMVCGCSGWFGVVICGVGTRLTVEPLHCFQHRSCSLALLFVFFYPGMVITKYKMRLQLFKHVV